MAQPELTGGHLFQFQDDHDLPLYTTEVPSIKIPVTSKYGDFADLNAWHVQIRIVMGGCSMHQYLLQAGTVP